jgi:hypothetical protein
MQDGTARSTRKVKLTDRNVRILPAVSGRTDYTDKLVRGFLMLVQTGLCAIGNFRRAIS